MIGSEIAVVWALFFYWLGDLVRALKMPGDEGHKLFFSGIRLVSYGGFLAWFIVSHWN